MALGYPNSILVAYPTRGSVPAFVVPPSKQTYVYNVRAFNNSGDAQNVGICRKTINSQLGLFSYLVSGPTYTNIPLSSVAGGVTLVGATTGNGFEVQSDARFNVFGVHVVTGHDSGVYVYEYWNGSAFTTLTTLTTPTFDSSATGTDQWLSFQAPIDWVPGGQTGDTRYSIRVRATAAPGSAVTINNLWVGQFLEYYQGVPNNAAVQLSFPDSKPFLLNGGEELFPYFDTAADANQFGCFYSVLS